MTDKNELKREEWMEMGMDDMLGSDPTPRRKRKELEREEEERKRQAIRQERELNPAMKPIQIASTTDSGSSSEINDSDTQTKRKYEFGDRGSSWRMMKLKRVLETAEKEQRPLNEVALERYGSITEFNEAIQEKEYLESKSSQGKDGRRGRTPPIADNAGMNRTLLSKERSQFLKPKPQDEMVKSENIITSQSKNVRPNIQAATSEHVPSLQELNRLKSQALKAKLMKRPDAAALDKQYQEALRIYQKHEADRTSALASAHEAKQETRGSQEKSIRDEISALVKEERLRGKDTDMDRALARKIATSGSFQNSLEYMDDNADTLSSTVSKKSSKQNESLNKPLPTHLKHKSTNCPLCLNANERFRNRIIASGTAIHLTVPDSINMVDGQCQIVPNDHVISTLELDDTAWSEIRNFQKALIQMYASKNQSIIFFEQLVNPKWQNHAVIECIPVPNDFFDDAPAYFKEAFLGSEEEWSQHKKVIDTSRGFRRAMVKDLPYFHVWFDPNNGMGHVIEDPESWPQWFGREVIAGPLDLPPERWRRPKKLNDAEIRKTRSALQENFKSFDWTLALKE